MYKSTSPPEHFWKNARRCGAKHISKSECTKHLDPGALLEKCTPLWREAHDEVKMRKMPQVRDGPDHFRKLRCTKKHAASKCEKHNKFGTLSNIVKRVGFLVFSKTLKNDGRRATSAKMHVAWQAQYKRHPRHVRRSGSRFPERGCILEHQIFRSAKMILHDSHGTSYDLAPLFRGKRSTLETWDRTIAKRIGTRPLALHSTV